MFNKLTSDTFDMIVDKNLKQLADQLADKNVRIDVSQSVKRYLSEKCFDSTASTGARMLDRMIDTNLKQKIADEILFGKLQHGGKVKAVITDSEIKLEYSKMKKAVAAPA
jgi:ATP-dependent Clp protease ATP-binding subunit ClpA